MQTRPATALARSTLELAGGTRRERRDRRARRNASLGERQRRERRHLASARRVGGAVLRALLLALLPRLHGRPDHHDLVQHVEPEGRAERDGEDGDEPAEGPPAGVVDSLPARFHAIGPAEGKAEVVDLRPDLAVIL